MDKFAEGIELPQGIDAIDASWAGPSGQPCGSSTFADGDIVNLRRLPDKLEQPARPIDVWLAGQLTPGTVAALASYRGQGSDAPSMRALLLRDINRLLDWFPRSTDTQRFRGVDIPRKVQTLITQALQGGDLPSLNRLLMEDAYPQELARNEIYLFRGPQLLDLRREHAGTE